MVTLDRAYLSWKFVKMAVAQKGFAALVPWGENEAVALQLDAVALDDRVRKDGVVHLEVKLFFDVEQQVSFVDRPVQLDNHFDGQDFAVKPEGLVDSERKVGIVDRVILLDNHFFNFAVSDTPELDLIDGVFVARELAEADVVLAVRRRAAGRRWHLVEDQLKADSV